MAHETNHDVLTNEQFELPLTDNGSQTGHVHGRDIVIRQSPKKAIARKKNPENGPQMKLNR